MTVVGQSADGSYEGRFTSTNASSLPSATRPPAIGFQDRYKESVGAATDWFSETTGIGNTTSQELTWTEKFHP